MGRAFQALCAACQHTFPAAEGGGFHSDRVRCKKCGRDEVVLHEDIQDTFLAYLKGWRPDFPELIGPDGSVWPGEPITRREYRRRLVAKVGPCECGGRFSFTAPMRCPACGSESVSDDGSRRIMFD